MSVRFGTVVALQDVSLVLPPGTRAAVVGENGAGKSTLMKVLFGLRQPDSGTIHIGEVQRTFASPREAIATGIGMVHQHFELIPAFTALDNIILGAEPTRNGQLDRRKAHETIADLMARSGLSVDLKAWVANLSVAAQQRVEILKALYRQARVLILDEPTAVLSPAEAEELWAAVRRLSTEGVTVVFVTHKLDEVMAHSEQVTVLRQGRRVLHTATSDTTAHELAQAMVGGDSLFVHRSPLNVEEGLLSVPPESPSSTNNGERTTVNNKPPTSLYMDNLTVHGSAGEERVANVSLAVRAGEILGLAGVDGSGQQELLEAVIGLRPVAGGTIRLNGTPLHSQTVAERRAAGVGYVPEDRHRRAVVLPFRCDENAVLGRHREGRFASARRIIHSTARAMFLREAAKAFDVRGAAPDVLLSSLSGGNQQKLVLAREFSRQPALLVVAQPTRGLDFAATEFVWEALRRERDRGAAVLMQSLDLNEVLSLSDRVAVMLGGRVIAVVPRAEATEAYIGALMTGAPGDTEHSGHANTGGTTQ